MLLKGTNPGMDEYFEHIYHERRDFKYKTLIYYTSNFFDPAAQLWDNFVTEYLGEIAIEFKNTYAYLSVAQMGSNPEKNTGQNLVTHSL